MNTIDDDLLTTTQAAKALRCGVKKVRALYRRGILTGRTQQTINGHSSRILISSASIRAQLARETRTPLDTARRGLPTGVLR